MAYYWCKDCKGKFMALSKPEAIYFKNLDVIPKSATVAKRPEVTFCPYCGGLDIEGGDSARHSKKTKA